ncbi:hypothetical protein ACTTAM_15995 [Rhodobacter capsulatus]|uniref:hypothetical protein n=1 Tax=Rhodobacter capsulatus TaxID=1061 RepID=UPI0040282615
MLIFVETAAQAGDAEALLLFGTLYDAAVTDPTVETQLGLSFADAPPRRPITIRGPGRRARPRRRAG